MMPENETLVADPRSASRWLPVIACLDDGQSPTDVFQQIQDQFYSVLQRIWRQWRSKGISVASLFKAALEDANLFQEMLRKAKFDRNVRLLGDVASSLQVADLEALIDSFIDAAWDVVRSQLQLDRLEDKLAPEFLGRIQAMLDRICRLLKPNLSRFPSRPKKEPPPDLDSRLGQSLL